MHPIIIISLLLKDPAIFVEYTCQYQWASNQLFHTDLYCKR